MEIAKLILDFVSVLIWPVTLITIWLAFKEPIRRVLDRVLSRSEKIELQIGGQRLSINLAKEVVKDAIETAVVDLGEKPDPKKLDLVASGTGELLTILMTLSNEDIRTLGMLAADTKVPQKRLGSTVSRLIDMGLVKADDQRLSVTNLGLRINSFTYGRDIDETLHKISQAM